MKNLNIDLYLRTAFRELDQFSIPDIGTFRKIYRSASVSGDMELVKPPLIAVEFEEQVYDSLNLTRYLQNIIQFPEGESQQIVMSIRNAMLEDFDKKQRFEIPEIGVLRRKENGQLTFMPADQEKNLFSTDFFGMKPVSLPGAPANVVTMEHQDNLGPMTMKENTKKKTLAGSIGWRPILVVLMFIGLGTLLITNGPFITGGKGIVGSEATLADSAKIAQSEPLEQLDNVGALPEAGANGGDDSAFVAGKKTDSVAAIVSSEIAETAAPDQESQAAPAVSEGTPAGTEAEGVLADATVADRSISDATRGLEGPQPTDIGVLDTLKKTARMTPPAAARPETTSPAAQPHAERKMAQPVEQVDTYHLIIGSFSTSQAAAALVKDMEAEGMKATILFPSAGSAQSYRVSIFSDKDKNQVVAYNQMLQKLGKKTGWVFAKSK